MNAKKIATTLILGILLAAATILSGGQPTIVDPLGPNSGVGRTLS